MNIDLNFSNKEKYGNFLKRNKRKVDIMSIADCRIFRLTASKLLGEIADKLERVEVKAGTILFNQNDRGDYFYIIEEGEVEVWREEYYDDEPLCVARLMAGDSFGEEAIILGGGRNATIKIVSQAQLLRLSKEDYLEQIFQVGARYVSPETARSLCAEGAKIIDVRYDEEFEELSLPGSLHLPLPDIRAELDNLDREKHYLVLCAKGQRAAVAALLMGQAGYRADIIEGGLYAWNDV